MRALTCITKLWLYICIISCPITILTFRYSLSSQSQVKFLYPESADGTSHLRNLPQTIKALTQAGNIKLKNICSLVSNYLICENDYPLVNSASCSTKTKRFCTCCSRFQLCLQMIIFCKVSFAKECHGV